MKIASNKLGYFLLDKYKKVLDNLIVHEYDDIITLTSIIIKPEYRRKGYGSKIIKEILDYSIKKGKPVRVEPTSLYGTPLRILKKFYKSLGFVEDKTSHKDMIFYP